VHRRTTRTFTAIVVGTLGLSITPVARSQYTANSQTNIISGVTSNWTGNYYVGNSFSTNVLIVQSNGVLTSSGGYLGYDSSSSNNSALVTDAGSIWSNGFLYVGNYGYGNSLVVSNGAQVLVSGFAQVGAGSLPKIGSNSVLVTGNGSVWSNGQDLAVGYPVAGNRVVVNNGGQFDQTTLFEPGSMLVRGCC
jgi:T5SS/PEP-CTERM-associated repeat protein